MPVWFLAHGGGPLPLLGDKTHAEIVNHWKSLAATLPEKPKTILVISAHWEEDKATVTTSPSPPMLYDYYNMPPQAYEIQYNAPGDPELAKRVTQLIRDAGIETAEDSQRGFDHGAFVPLKLIFPQADVPVVTLSLLSDLDAKRHIQLGEAIAPLRDESVLIMGSGLSFHNMRAFRGNMAGQKNAEAAQKSKEFDDWLQDTLATGDHTPEERKALFADWPNAPSGRYSHPREEHLLPAHVALGAGGGRATVMFSGSLFGASISSLRWD